jgi:hypothetical protein
MKHGTTTGYHSGCRCDPCRGAYSVYMSAWRQANLERERERRRRDRRNRLQRDPAGVRAADRARSAAWRKANRTYFLQLTATHARNAQRQTAEAPRRRLPWTPEEDAWVVRTDFSALEVALLLGRTFHAVQTRRQKLSRIGPRGTSSDR